MSGEGSVPFGLGVEDARLFEASPEASFVVRGSRIEAVNERFVEMLGHDPTGGEVRETIPEWREGFAAETPFEADLRSAPGVVSCRSRCACARSTTASPSSRCATPGR